MNLFHRRSTRRRKLPASRVLHDARAFQRNALGLCAYDAYPCHLTPTIWVEWRDLRGKSGEGAYCISHTVVLITGRTATYASTRFPDRTRVAARGTLRQWGRVQ